MATPHQEIVGPVSTSINPDAELLAITDHQLRMFEALDLFPSHHISRIADHVSFPAPGQQLCRRELQLRLPSVSAALGEQRGPFIVSLGQFRRRRLPDLRVVDGTGRAVNLLSRRQHGHVLAIALLRPHFAVDEWDLLGADQQLRIALDTLRQYLSRLITSIIPNEVFTPAGAAEQLPALLAGVQASVQRIAVEVAAFELRCEEAILATRHLCWVEASSGTMIQLHASWTQPEAPQPSHESMSVARPDRAAQTSGNRPANTLRRRWRDFRNRQYALAKMMPVRYVFATPAYIGAGSYYFALTPPQGTEVLLLDWDDGCRYSVDETGVPATATTELESATWSYHFHNHRLTERRRQRDRRAIHTADRRRATADRRDHERRTTRSESRVVARDRRASDRRRGDRRRGEQRQPERRQADRRGGKTAALIHVFVRSEQKENGKLVAIGLLSLGLAVIAARGVLQNAGSDNASQILLLAPAALVLLVDQQSHHHFAALTRVYRLVLWLYIVVALLFAASLVYSVPSIPLVPGNTTTTVPRVASAIFAIASGLLALAFAWAGGYFSVSTVASYRRVCRRMRLFGTWSLTASWLRYKRRGEHRRRTTPLSDHELGRARKDMPTHEVYAKLARHSGDFVALLAIAASTIAICAMFLGHWGEGEACALTRVHAERIATQTRSPLTLGKCIGGTTTYSLGPASPASAADTRR